MYSTTLFHIYSTAQASIPNAESMNPIAGPFVFPAAGCRRVEPVEEESEPVCSATGAGTMVRSVTVTTPPSSCVEVYTCMDVIDCSEAEVIGLDVVSPI